MASGYEYNRLARAAREYRRTRRPDLLKTSGDLHRPTAADIEAILRAQLAAAAEEETRRIVAAELAELEKTAVIPAPPLPDPPQS